MHQSIVHRFMDTAQRRGEAPALREKIQGQWQTRSWTQYAQEVKLAARGLMKLGLQAGGSAAIVGSGCSEWLIGNMGVMATGCAPAPLYPNATAEQAKYIVEHCGAKLLIADTMQQVEKLRAMQPQGLETYVLMKGRGAGVTTWDELLALGETVPQAELDARMDALEPEGLATLIYTSGTTGPPKGVMLTHKNLVFTAWSLLQLLDFTDHEELICYLPLSHIAEQIVSIHIPASMGATVNFAESIDKLGDNLREVRPTLFLAVPRVWEKIQAKMTAAGKQNPPLKRKIAAWARSVGLETARRSELGLAPPWTYPLAKKLVFSKVRERLGLDRCRLCATAAAPIARSTLDFFFSLDVPIYEIYGMSEDTGPATVSTPTAFKRGSAGRAIPETKVRVASDGEICMFGDHIFPGYLHDAEQTAEALDEEGWLHSGDIGVIDANGFVSITDRKKDLIITAGGKNIAPQNLEAEFKSISGIGQVCVIGDRMKFLVALMTVDREEGAAVAQEIGAATTDPDRLHEDAKFLEHVTAEVHRINEKLARYESIKQFRILPHEFTVDSGELTPTMKMKRKVVLERHREIIRDLYPQEDHDSL